MHGHRQFTINHIHLFKKNDQVRDDEGSFQLIVVDNILQPIYLSKILTRLIFNILMNNQL